MTKEIISEMLAQNNVTCGYTFKEITQENSPLKLNGGTASVGFIYRHIGEITHLLIQFFGIPTDVSNTTMGHEDTGATYNFEESRALVDEAYMKLERLVEDYSEHDWLENIETPFFGTISRIRLFGHILYHIAYHCGQIHLTLKRGQPLH